MVETRPLLTRDGFEAILRDIAGNAALALVYFVAGKLGLALALFNRSASPVWPPTGIALAVLLLFGRRFWPGVWVGAFLVNLTTAGTVWTSVAIATGNTLEVLIAAGLAERFAGGRRFPDRARDIIRFTLLAAVPGTIVSPTIGVTSLLFGGYVLPADFASVWTTWWLGDLVSAVILAPFVLIWSALPSPRWNRRHIGEALLVLATTAGTGVVLFCGVLPPWLQGNERTFMAIPPLLWAALRFGTRGAITSVMILAGVASWGTLRGFGPLVFGGPNHSLLLVQAFMGTIALSNLVLGAVVTEELRGEDALRESRSELRRRLQEIEGLYRTAPVGLCQVDTDLRIVRINEHLAAMHGEPAASQRGRTVREAQPELADALEPLLRTVLDTGEPLVDREIIGPTPARPGDPRNWMTSHYPLHGADGAVLGVNVVVQDITGQKRAEAELLAWHQELESRVRARTSDLSLAYRELGTQMAERRRLESQIARGVESEQIRLGSELHDGLGQQLTALSLLLATLREKLKVRAPDLARETGRLQSLVEVSIRQTQSIARRLYPVELERFGLVTALKILARSTRRSFGASCTIRSENLSREDLRGPAAIQLFRIAQEAVHNAVKHGRATRIVVEIASAGGDITLSVRDDGAGLPADLDASRGMGLRIMLYRARMMGGTLEIRNQPGGGAIMTCTVSAKRAAEPAGAGDWERRIWDI